MPEPSKRPLVAVILPVSGTSEDQTDKPLTGSEALEIASKHFQAIVKVDYNPNRKLWTVKMGFYWGRDETLDKAAGVMLQKAMPSWDAATKKET